MLSSATGLSVRGNSILPHTTPLAVFEVALHVHVNRNEGSSQALPRSSQAGLLLRSTSRC